MTGIFIIARLGSKRLPEKHLTKIGNLTLLDILVQRIVSKFEDDLGRNDVKLVIATSDEDFNRKFEPFAKHYPLEVFYGNINNIPVRLQQCAEHFGCENIVSVDGDDILCSAEAMYSVHQLLSAGVPVVKTTGLPLGMNVMGFQLRVLQKVIGRFSEAGMLETGWGRIFSDIEVYEEKMVPSIGDQNLRFTLDYQQDADFFNQVVMSLGSNIVDATDSEIINLVLESEFYKINNKLNDIYWMNFNAEKNNEDL